MNYFLGHLSWDQTTQVQTLQPSSLGLTYSNYLKLKLMSQHNLKIAFLLGRLWKVHEHHLKVVMSALPDAPADHEAGMQLGHPRYNRDLNSKHRGIFWDFDGFSLVQPKISKILVKRISGFSGCQICRQVSYLHMQRQRQVLSRASVAGCCWPLYSRRASQTSGEIRLRVKHLFCVKFCLVASLEKTVQDSWNNDPSTLQFTYVDRVGEQQLVLRSPLCPNPVLFREFLRASLGTENSRTESRGFPSRKTIVLTLHVLFVQNILGEYLFRKVQELRREQSQLQREQAQTVLFRDGPFGSGWLSQKLQPKNPIFISIFPIKNPESLNVCCGWIHG